MKTKGLQKTTGMKLAVLSFVLFMFLTGTINAQDHHHGPPPPRPNLDSIIASHDHAWDSILGQHAFDTILVCHRGHDSLSLPPFWSDSTPVAHGHDSIPGSTGGDSTWAGGGKHDSIPGPPPSTGGDSTWTGGRHDSIPSPPPPPNWGDSSWTGGGYGHDSIPGPPPPPPSWGDSTWTGNGDSIPGPPPPPPGWGDTSWTGGNNDSVPTPPHHKDLLTASDNAASATLFVFPNPVFETATIRIQNAGSTVTFKMYESNGRLVQVMNNLSNGDFQLNKWNLTSGIYFYEMLDGNTIATKGSLVIQ
jgi:hypothetical protein